jgi:hypothetical protein
MSSTVSPDSFINKYSPFSGSPHSTPGYKGGMEEFVLIVVGVAMVVVGFEVGMLPFPLYINKYPKTPITTNVNAIKIATKGSRTPLLVFISFSVA